MFFGPFRGSHLGFVIGEVRFDRSLAFLAHRVKGWVNNPISPQCRIGFLLRRNSFGRRFVRRACAFRSPLTVMVVPSDEVIAAAITFAATFENCRHVMPLSRKAGQRLAANRTKILRDRIERATSPDLFCSLYQLRCSGYEMNEMY